MTLSELQNWLKKHKIDGYIVNHNNMFFGQDILPEENKIMQLTGFSGSAGSLLVMQNKNILIVDGRYEIQSKLETNPSEVEILCNPSATPFSSMVCQFNEAKKYKILYDPWTIGHDDLTFYAKQLKNIKFIADNQALLGPRLSSKQVKVFEHKIEYCGEERDEKIAEVIKKLITLKLDAILITEADDVSWLLNLRSNALPDSPVLRAYAILTKDGEVTIFGDHLDYVEILPFSALKKALHTYKKQKIGIMNNAPQIVYELLPNDKCSDTIVDTIKRIKTVKNPVEIQGIQKAHRRDAAAIINFLHWFDNSWQKKTELDIVAKLRSFREQQELFYSDSFSTIAGFGPNSAIIHYQPKPETNLELGQDSILLLDSGAQYYDGTTDITRTLAIGNPTSEMVDDFTLILKCHIELASTYFPYTADGKQLDSICRRQLWQTGRDYKHGTGHGVGCFLNVHEGPALISPNGRRKIYTPGMITSIEPGYYKEGAYGIRIENLYYIDEVEKEFEIKMLQFKPLTLVPLDKRLINKYLLNQGEVDWLNNYHQKVWEEISPLLEDRVKTWLKEACAPL